MAFPEFPPAAPVRSSATNEPSFFRTVVVLYAALFVIACALIGLCFLIPYLVASRVY